MSKLIHVNKKGSQGFTIVELLIVIVIIGILAAITLVSYSGISQKASESAIGSDLSTTKKRLELYKINNGSYPTSLDAKSCPLTPVADPSNCFGLSSADSVNYFGNSENFNLSTKKGNSKYDISNSNSIINTTQPASCPSGFIPVPGSSTYGTKGFCVMKYEAKNDGSGNAVSTAAGTLWSGINQNDAIAKSAAVCAGCHLITEAEWMTIAQNILSVSANWSGGAVGSGYVYSGNCDGSPVSVSTVNDNDGYYLTGNSAGDSTVTSGMIGDSQRRTLFLNNGEVIWDMSGNLWDWSSAQMSSGKPGSSLEPNTSRGREWNEVDVKGNFVVNPYPIGTGLANAGSWTGNTNHIGKIFSMVNDVSLEGLAHGSNVNGALNAGILNLSYQDPTYGGTTYGFRVAK